MLSFYFALSLIINVMSDTVYRDEDCVRLRKPFHRLTEDERMLYVKGYQALRRNGKLALLSQAHAANIGVHKGSSFFFLHAYMIWEAETAIRELGDEYKCFSMPYWDYTRDSGLESNPTIFHLNVGANGNNRHDFCMDDPLWSVNNYWSTDADSCMNDEQRNPPRCCLKRSVSDTQLLPNVMQIASVYVRNSNFLLFETQIDHYHVWPHFYLAVNTWSQMATAYAIDDPLFFLLHTFTLYQRALWTTCYQYDQFDVSELQNHHDAYTPSCNPNMDDCGVVGIDAKYNVYPLDETDWAIASKVDITPRKLYNIEDWNVQYDLGDFWIRSKLNEWCPVTPNPKWFVTVSDYVENEGYSNELEQFIDETWMDLKSQQKELGLSDEEMYFAVESMSCKYHRETSENSCFDDVMNNNEYETCESRNIYANDDISLDEMLQFDGVKENQCLTKRRQQIYSVSNLDDSVKLALCNGEYDYKCTEWSHPNVDALQMVHSIQSNRYGNYAFVVLISICIFAVLLLVSYPIKHRFYDKKHIQQDTTHGIYGTFGV